MNCLLYPYNDSVRYDQTLLVSGGMDFSVILWDLSSGTQLYSFSVHAGEINRLITPPDNCNVSTLGGGGVSLMGSVICDAFLCKTSILVANYIHGNGNLSEKFFSGMHNYAILSYDHLVIEMI